MGDHVLQDRITELEEENRKLRRINAALIERVESSTLTTANPYAHFEHSVTLAEQVRERTEALHRALSELKASHEKLEQANATAAQAHQRLVDAIESISDAFVLFDKERRIVLFNKKFRDIWRQVGQRVMQGVTIDDMRRLAVEHRLITEDYGTTEDGNRIFRLLSGQWIQMSERETADGGLVTLYTDISHLKASETAKRELALAQKSRLLQRTIDNLSQGVALVNPSDQLTLWNDRFLALTGLRREQVETHPPFRSLNLVHNHQSPEEGGQSGASSVMSINEHIIEVRTHAMPDGGYVNTYTDITERHHYAETLKQSEEWIRLITDHVPALIAYVGGDLCYRFTNKVYDEWYGWERGTLIGQRINDVYSASHMAALSPYIQQVMSGENITFEIAEQHFSGSTHYMLKSYVPNHGAEGDVIGFFVLIRDITERRKVAMELESAYQLLEQRVAERTAKLTQLNTQLRLEVDERTQAEGRLREAKKEAEQANLSKTKFLAAVSHDILQPLNAARLFASALTEKPLNHSTRSLVDSMSYALRDVESLLGTLVDISKLDAGVVVPDVTTFRISELLENLANEFDQFAQVNGLQMHYVPSTAIVSTDSQLLARILRNLLANAVRYTESGKILLGCRRRDEQLIIEVWDTGAGIPRTQLNVIFQEFKRLRANDLGRDKGLGLGLAIVDKIARVLSLSVAVRSKVGKGSCFSVAIPLGRIAQLPVVNKEAVTPVAETLCGAVVWVIDNDHAICEGMQSLLSSWGCRVVAAGSLAELSAKTVQFRSDVDIIVADYHLDNNEKGIDVVNHILGCRPERPAQVLMVTANYSQSLKQEIRARGYLLMNKPVKPLKLKTTLVHLAQLKSNASVPAATIASSIH